MICAAVEHSGGGQAAAFEAIADRVRRNTDELLGKCERDGTLPRVAATALARERVAAATRLRRAL